MLEAARNAAVTNLVSPTPEWHSPGIVQRLKTERHKVDDRIDLKWHKDHVKTDARRLAAQHPLIASKDISANDLLAAYKRHVRNSEQDIGDRLPQHQDMLVIRAWNGLSGWWLERAVKKCAKIARKRAGAEKIVELAGGAELWTQKLRELVSDRSAMRKMADDVARRMKLAGIPFQDFGQPS